MGLTKVLGGVLLLALLYSPVRALGVTPPGPSSVVLAWDNSLSPDISGYRVYYGEVSGNYLNSVEVGNVTTGTIPGLASGVTYYFALTALNASGLESDFSGEIAYTVPAIVPGEPSTVQIRVASNNQVMLTWTGQTGHTYDIQATEDLSIWTVIGTMTPVTNGSMEFTDPNAASFPNRFYRTHDTQP